MSGVRAREFFREFLGDLPPDLGARIGVIRSRVFSQETHRTSKDPNPCISSGRGSTPAAASAISVARVIGCFCHLPDRQATLWSPQRWRDRHHPKTSTVCVCVFPMGANTTSDCVATSIKKCDKCVETCKSKLALEEEKV